VGLVLYALLFLPALLGIAYVLRPRRVRLVEEAAAVVPANPFDTIDAILGQLESATLDERGVDELERLAAELEAAASQLERTH
jgi:hypothetical protein